MFLLFTDRLFFLFLSILKTGEFVDIMTNIEAGNLRNESILV